MRVVNVDNEYGIVPLSALFPRFNTSRDGKFLEHHTFSEMEPENLLNHKFTTRKYFNFAILSGIGKPIRLFCRCKNRRYWSSPMESGSFPNYHVKLSMWFIMFNRFTLRT